MPTNNKPTDSKKKAPIDSTMRNVRAANKRIKALEDFADYVNERFKTQTLYTSEFMFHISNRLEKLEKKTPAAKR